VDEQLLDILQTDGRTSYLDLAERIGVSRAAVTSRLNTLLQQGALRVIAAVHPEVLGIKAIAHISVKTSGPTTEIVDALVGWVEVVLVSVVSGAYDLVIEVRVRDQQALYETVSRLRALSGVVEVNSLLYADVLLGSFMPRAPLDPNVQVDEDDLKLIRLLQEDGRLSYRSLAATIGLSASTVRNRVNALLASNVIRIGASVDRRRGKNSVAAGFGLNVTDDGSAVLDTLRSIRGVEFLARTIGRFDLVATVAAESTAGLRSVVELLRVTDTVMRVESWVHLETVKERYDWPLDRLMVSSGDTSGRS
jgi:DNA-binding Lrp family transcriptional regulator